MDRKITVALAGNPNSGKTTLFNNLTGFRHHVGNYPGVTVEKKEGTCRHGDVEVKVVDLPGTYSLTAYSLRNWSPGVPSSTTSRTWWSISSTPPTSRGTCTSQSN